LRSQCGQYDDLEGAAARILFEADEEPDPDPPGEHPSFRQEGKA
jgi:nitrogen fixation-related uncharacterized protein